MTERIYFTVPSIPIAQPRPRAFAINGKARVFGAPKSHAIHVFKASVQMAFQVAAEKLDYDVLALFPISEPVSLRLLFVLPRPKLPKKAGVDRLPHAKRPDCDNLYKGFADALGGLAWKDDGCIWRAEIIKCIAAASEQPHVEVEICWDSPAPMFAD